MPEKRTQACLTCAQRSPSEALSPSAGPSWDRPTAISSDVWLRPKLHRTARSPTVRVRMVQAVRRASGPSAGGWAVPGQWPPACGFGPPGVAAGSGPLAASAAL
ncbi:hypothetical protein Shyhy01_73280 [Streptomyces hygroscopicus subsp. hygroscopicus]|nr:hypothetical protein Shyhy01_73280 [Streptomyces hygroscopicus subsp. hygroscopicus]